MPTFHTELVLAHHARTKDQAERQAGQFMEVAMEKLGITGVTVERTKVIPRPGATDQQASALRVANGSRSYRATLKRAIHKLSRVDGLEQAALILEQTLAPELKTMRVCDLLAACRYVSHRGASRMVDESGIGAGFGRAYAKGKTLEELTPRQRDLLANRLRDAAGRLA